MFYGAAFPDFITHDETVADLPYLSDVARLEMHHLQAYHAADMASLASEHIAHILSNPEQAESLPHALFSFHPSLHLLRSPYAIVGLWSAHQNICDIADIDPYQAENALIIRAGFNVNVIQLNHASSTFIAQLLLPTSFGEAVAHTFTLHPDFDLPATLGLLIRQQAITAITL